MIDMSEITAIAEIDISGFCEAVDVFACEKKSLAFLEALPLESTRSFVMNNMKQGYPQFVTVDANSATLSQISEACLLSLWYLGYWASARIPGQRYRTCADAASSRSSPARTPPA
jgi:hypothetical protein